MVNIWKHIQGYIWHSNITSVSAVEPTLHFCCFLPKGSDQTRKSLSCRNLQDQLAVTGSEEYLCSSQVKRGFCIKKVSYKIIQTIAVTFLEQAYEHCLFSLPDAPTITLLPMAWQLLKLSALLRRNSLVISTLLITSATMLEMSWRKKQHGKKQPK